MFPNSSGGGGGGGGGVGRFDSGRQNGNPFGTTNPFDADPSGGFNALVQSRTSSSSVRGGRGVGRGGRFGNSISMDTSRGGGRGGRFGNSMAIDGTMSTPRINPMQSPFFVGNSTTDFSDIGDGSFNTSVTSSNHSRTTFARPNVSSVRKNPYLGKAKSPFDTKPMPTCRVCSKQFESFDELKKHIRVENHHNDATANATTTANDTSMTTATANPITSRLRDRPISPRGKPSQSMTVTGKETALSNMKEKLRMSMSKQGVAHKKFAAKPMENKLDNAVLQISAIGPNNVDDIQNMDDDENAITFDDNDYQAADEEDDDPSDSNIDDGSDADEGDDEGAIMRKEAMVDTTIIAQKIVDVPMRSELTRTTDSVLGGEDSGSSMIGTCEDMCPSDERDSRTELQLLEPFEKEHPDIPGTAKDLMIKEFKRSSADYLLLIPHRIRTPATLLKTIRYIEDNIMEKDKQDIDPRFGCVPPSITVYLFIWDRYRMIAKDFILQEFAICVDEVYMECHERMARWFILMDHTMQKDDKFNEGHLQQNRESTNKLFKTLLECYKDPKLAHIPMPNKAEFISYYLLEQMGNGGEVAKLMRQLSFEVRSSEKLRFVAEVWAAWKMKDYSRYFRLLQKADACQASLMHRYVGDIRLAGIKKMVRSYFFKGSISYYPLHDLINLFMFEDLDDALVFLRHCGIAVEDVLLSTDDTEETLCAVFLDQRIQDLLPRDKNGHTILPKATHMLQGIDFKYVHHSLGEVCRGALSAICVFDDSKVVPTAPRHVPLNRHPATIKVPVKAVAEKIPIKTVATPKQNGPKPSSAALAMLNSALGEGSTNKKLEQKVPARLKVDLDVNTLLPTVNEPTPSAPLETTDHKASTPFQFVSSLHTKQIAEETHALQQSVSFRLDNTFSAPSLKEVAEPFVQIQQAPPIDTAAQLAILAAQQRKAEEEEQRKQREEAAIRQREQEMLKEKQRLEVERLERLKEEQLVPIMHMTQKHLRKRSIMKSLTVWHKMALLRSRKHRRSVTHMFFRNWLRLLRSRQMRSRQIIFDLQCIDISRPNSLQTVIEADNSLAKETTEGLVSTLLPLMLCSPCSFTPSLSVAAPLFRTQCGAVRKELGYLDTDLVDASPRAGPLWQGDLFWKLALLSDAQIEGHYHSDDSFLTSAIRALLTSQAVTSAADGVIGLWRDSVEISLARHVSVVRTVHSSVIDVCNSFNLREVEMMGTQAALMIVTLSGGLGGAAMAALRICIRRSLPVVLVVEVGSSEDVSSMVWEELPHDLRGHDAVLELLRNMSSDLGYNLVDSGYISKVLAVRTCKTMSTSHANVVAQEVHRAATGCEHLVSAILFMLATACRSFPLVHRVNIYDLLDNGLSEVIFRPISKRSVDDDGTAGEMLDKLRSMNGSLDDFLALLESTETAGNAFPAPEFSADYCSFNERPNSVLPVDGALFQETANCPPGSNYLPVFWMQKTNIAIARTVINSLKIPLTICSQTHRSSSELVSSLLCGLQSCGWCISEHDYDLFESAVANLFNGDNYLWKKVFKVIVEKRIRALEEKNRFSFLYLLFKSDVFTRPPSKVMNADMSPFLHTTMGSTERSPYKRSFSLLNSPANLSKHGVQTNDKRLRSDDSLLYEQENINFLNEEASFLSEEKKLQNLIENAVNDGLSERSSDKVVLTSRDSDWTGEKDINFLLSKSRNERASFCFFATGEQ